MKFTENYQSFGSNNHDIFIKIEFFLLKIYNHFAQEVVTLVSDKLPPGNYKYTWDVSGLASWVYCYKIEVVEYTQTLKLILN